MIPGPNLIYKCPQCGRKVSRVSIVSGNTIGATMYSDGKMIAPMLPDFPYIIKCKDCDAFYRLNDENKIGEFERWGDKNMFNTRDLYWAGFLSLDEYIEAIDLKIYNSVSEEQYLRRGLWWAFNDKYREGADVALNDEDRAVYESNCARLIEILDKDKIDERIMCAELYRNLGKYTECKNILETINDKRYGQTIELLIKECEKNNNRVILLRE